MGQKIEQGRTKGNRIDARLLGEVIGLVLLGNGYRPTLAGPTADAFDAAMLALGHPTRAWRGSRAERQVEARL